MPRVFACSECGGHRLNEDSFGVRSHPEDEECLLCALADGQGGQPGGARAAQVACRAVLDTAMGFPPEAVLTPAYWGTILRLADQATTADPEAGFTTLVGVAIRADKVYGASSGDSAVLTIDRVGHARELTRQQIKNPPVGSRKACFIPFAAQLTAPWIVLAMSDGVWKYVGWERVTEMGRRLRGQALIDSLQEAARLPGSRQFQDDFTVIVIQDRE